MKFHFLSLYVSVLIVSFGLRASGDDLPFIIGKEDLTSNDSWVDAGCEFTPAADGHLARLEFPPGKWTALIRMLPLEQMQGRLSVHLVCRWLGDLTTIKTTGCQISFQDSDRQDLPDGASAPLKISAESQVVTVDTPIPKDAASMRFDISSWGGGTLEIQDYEVYLKDIDLSRAAIQGINMPWLKVPGGASARVPLGAEGAGAEFTPKPPYSFDDPLWTKLPSYPISTTTCNKTPLNDVAASFQIAWTPDDLVVRFHAHDRTLNFKDATRYGRDCFEFFLMPTGRLSEASTKNMVRQEQYTVTRSADGHTDSTNDAITRLTSDGWEAILKIPLRTETRRIAPFNGLSLTFNAAYQDADVLPQEHWLSFSKADQTNTSWNNPDVYVPLVFQTDDTLAYSPLWLGNTSAYNVDPKFPGRINLIKSTADLKNIDFWDRPPDLPVTASAADGHNTFRFQFTPNLHQPRLAFTMSPFNVLAGETLTVEMEGKVDAGSPVKAPDVAFLAQSNWQTIGGKPSVPQLTAKWSKLSYSIQVPERFRDNLRNGRLLIAFGVFPGRTVELRDIVLTRRLPEDFDALISVPGHYSHLWAGENDIINFQFSSGMTTTAKILVEIRDYFSNKVVMSRNLTRDFTPDEQDMSWDVAGLPNGFFNVLLKARDANGKFLADRELYISKGMKASKPSSYAGIFISNNFDVTAPQDVPATVSTLQNLGIKMAQWGDFMLFDSEGNDLTEDPLFFEKGLHAAGFETGSTIPRTGTHDINRDRQPDELLPFYNSFFTKTKGLFSHFSFANEPNLTSGWSPAPDGREWAIFARGFHESLKKDAPGTQPILGSFNSLPIDYIKSTAEENLNSFGDAIYGLHLYGLEPNADGFKTMMTARAQLDQIHPGWGAWDTESGLVYYSFRSLLDLQSKKMPILLCSGYTRSYFFNIWDLLFPCGDSNPLVPMEAFKNNFYLDSVPIGRVTLADGKVQAYLFRNSSGRGLAAFWNTSHDSSSIDLPAHAGGELFDVFGNSLGALTEGQNDLALADRFVRYATGVDLDSLMKDSTFVAAFKPSQDKPAEDPDYTTGTYLSLPNATKAFDREISVGEPSDLTISLHNFEDIDEKLTLGSQVPDGLKVEFDNHGEFTLKARESRIITVRLTASKDLDQQPFALTGRLDTGKKLLPLVFTVKTTPPLNVTGYTRSVEIQNNSPLSSDVEVLPSKEDFFFNPEVIKATLQPAASLVVPIDITQKGNFQSNFASLNTKLFYDLSVKSAQVSYTKSGSCILFSPESGENSDADFNNLPFAALPEYPGPDKFQVNYRLSWVSGDLRITAKVHDTTPFQDQEGGGLRSGGDCMIVAFDTDHGQKPMVFGAGYFECGFAFSHQAPVSYLWEGRMGLETANPFPEAIKHISRDADSIYYDVIIPSSRLFPSSDSKNPGMSIVFINRGPDGKSQIIELGQGILPVRSPEKMGLLLRVQ